MHQITRAQAPLKFLPPNLQLWVLKLVICLLPHWLKHHLKISQINVSEIDRLVSVYKQSQVGTSRLILAFRHSSNDDMFCLGYLLTKLLPMGAGRHQIVLKAPVFAHFLYNSPKERQHPQGMTLWAGNFVTWLYRRIGGIPIYRGRPDRLALKTAKDLLVNGRMPLAIAPEGFANGHSEIVSPLDFGVAQMGFWGMEELLKGGRTEDVLIVPIGIQYYYVGEPWSELECLLSKLELDCGLKVDRRDSLVAIAQFKGSKNQEVERQPMQKLLYDRFYKISQYLIYQIENFYAQFYHYEIPDRPSLERAISRTTIAKRLQTMLNFALQVSENYFNINPKGTKLDRCRQIERAGWNWIYREELKNPDELSSIGRKLADRIATEADLRMWHMRILESSIAVTSSYIKDKPTVERFAETTLLLWDLVARIQGKNPIHRPVIANRRAEIKIGNYISIGDYWNRYNISRRESKQAVSDVTQKLQAELEATIE
jgi:1-acyl-sn-glycerol-3-phosphate acyltransferase